MIALRCGGVTLLAGRSPADRYECERLDRRLGLGPWRCSRCDHEAPTLVRMWTHLVDKHGEQVSE